MLIGLDNAQEDFCDHVVGEKTKIKSESCQ